MIRALIYDVVLIILSILALPRLFYQMLFHKKYRKSLIQRFGIGFPQIDKGRSKLVWVHAVSMGETKAVATLLHRIKAENPSIKILFTTVTETGFAESERSIPEADYRAFLPFDFKWIVAPIVRMVKPDYVILCESDFWYNFLSQSKKCGAKIALVNGKISEKSLRRFRALSWLSRNLFLQIDVFCVQSRHYRERFETLGIPKEKLTVTGNLKFDSFFPFMTEKELGVWKKDLRIPEEDLVLVAGSTHNPEEKLILDCVKKLWEALPNLTLVLVPRHPERFGEVAQIINNEKVAYRRLSAIDVDPKDSKVLLVDAMGKLRQCYQLATVAIVAGSFTAKVGGHNIIEPLWYRVPVVYGPEMHSQPELLELMQQYNAGVQVNSEELYEALLKLLQNHAKRDELGSAGERMIADFKGATEKSYRAIF